MSPLAPSWESGPPASHCSGEGLRTATAQVDTPRIITPSSTAWPPMGASFGAWCAAEAAAPAPLSETFSGALTSPIVSAVLAAALIYGSRYRRSAQARESELSVSDDSG